MIQDRGNPLQLGGPSGSFDDAERLAPALALIEMEGVADLSTKVRLFLPAVADRCASGKRSTAILTSNLNDIPLRRKPWQI